MEGAIFSFSCLDGIKLVRIPRAEMNKKMKKQS